jgi:hypothetical protein
MKLENSADLIVNLTVVCLPFFYKLIEILRKLKIYALNKIKKIKCLGFFINHEEYGLKISFQKF